MPKYFPRLKIFVLLLFFVITLIPFSAVYGDMFSWALNGAILYFPADNGVDSDPAPIIPSGGFSLSLRLLRFLQLEFTEDIYFTNYEYNSVLGYPMACNPENRSAFVLGFITGINAAFFLPLGNSALRVYGGPAADLRIITLAIGLNHPADYTGEIETDVQLQTDAIRKYFWEKGRWFMPVTGIGFDFPVNERFQLGVDFRTWYPVYKIWTDDNTSAIDGWRFGASLRFGLR